MTLGPKSVLNGVLTAKASPSKTLALNRPTVQRGLLLHRPTVQRQRPLYRPTVLSGLFLTRSLYRHTDTI